MYFLLSLILIQLRLIFFLVSVYFLTSLNVLIFQIKLLNFFFNTLKIYFFIDWISAMFCFIVLFISIIVFYYRNEYMGTDKNSFLFIIITFLFVISIILIVIRINIFMILLGWDGLGVTSYCLVIYYQNSYSNYAGIITILTNRLGDICLVFNIFFLGLINLWDINYLYNNYNLIIVIIILAAINRKSSSISFFSLITLPL